MKKVAIGCGSALAALIVLIVIVVVATGGRSGSPASQPAAPDKPTTQTSKQPVASTPKQPQTLLDLSGSGTKQTQVFAAASDWDLAWTYNCSNFGDQGNFVVEVMNRDTSPSFENQSVNQLGSKGSDVQHYHKGGSFYLSINSECNWTVKATG